MWNVCRNRSRGSPRLHRRQEPPTIEPGTNASAASFGKNNLNLSLDMEPKRTPTSLNDGVDALTCFGAAMWRAGSTAIRTREWIEVVARKMDFDAVALSLSLENVTASVCRSGEWATATRMIEPPAVNTWRIGQLENLARAAEPKITGHEFAAKLPEIESTPPRYSSAQIFVAIGLASGGFAFLNGAAALEMIAAAIGGGIGQWFRLSLSRRRVNQYGAAALSAIVASGTYALVAALANALGFRFTHYPAGFIASVLFLVPGFPLIAALFDLLQYQTIAALSRLAYGVMMLLAVALGLSVVVVVAGVDLSRQPPIELAYPMRLLLRAAASFMAGSAFAISFNSPPRIVLAVGLLAMGVNDLRLVLNDSGVMLAPASFLAALAIGLVALLADRCFNVPRIAMTVAPIVIMFPGLYAFEMIVLFNRGKVLEALQASASCGFVIGALAMGLAAARFFNPR